MWVWDVGIHTWECVNEEHPQSLHIPLRTCVCLVHITCPHHHIGEGSRLMPGAGCMITAMMHATGKTPVVVGKGGDWLLGHLKERLQYNPKRVCGWVCGWVTECEDCMRVGLLCTSKQSANVMLQLCCTTKSTNSKSRAQTQTAMVGDRLDTDIALGKQGGLVTILVIHTHANTHTHGNTHTHTNTHTQVLTGVASEADVAGLPCEAQPDVVAPSLASLVGM